MGEFVAVLKAAELPPGEAVTVEVDGEEVALANVGGEIHAVDNRCPHADGSLGEGFLHDEVLTCPLHFWEFDVRTGECLTEPGECVRRFEVKVEDGVVLIRRGAVGDKAGANASNGAGQ